MVGQTISHYRVLEKLGEGGMGEVWKAEDTKLERTVALKFLAAHLLNDDEAKQRFMREAKAAAGLDHPNICTVYEIAEAEGKAFLAMAFLKGETLEDRIAQGPLAIKDALNIGRQVAEGLEAAHEKGIVHRDIKPANILVAPDGRATIMDFGLARLTEASRLTKAEQTVGTAAYMSPEQMQGGEIDHRTDIWALGCVLYEMVAGVRPFKGEYHQALAYEIVQEEQEPLTGIRAGVPMELEFLVGKCLAKDREDRPGSAPEVARDLRTLAEKLKSGRSMALRASHMSGAVPAAEGPTQDLSAPQPVRSRVFLAAAGIGVLAFAALAARHFSEAPPRELPIVAFSAAAPQGRQPGQMSLSPDGRYLALSVLPPGSLWVRAIESDEWREINGTEGARYPFWSPDSTEIGFFAGDRLKKVPASGGPAQTIAEASDGRGGSWGEDGTILMAPDPFGQIQRVSSQGGEPEPVTQAADGVRISRRFPQWLPDGRHFFYSDGGDTDRKGIYLSSLDGEQPRRLLPDESNAAYLPGEDGSDAGLLLFVREGVLMAQPFDGSRLQLTGEAVALPVRPGGAGNGGSFGFTASRSGLLVHSRLEDVGPRRLIWVDRTGEVEERTNLVADALAMPRLSPDGRRVAYFSSQGLRSSVWVYDLAHQTRTRIDDDESAWPVWAPDGRQLVFTLVRNRLALRSADGTGPAIQLPVQAPNISPWDWSADGRILYQSQDSVTGFDLAFLQKAESADGDWKSLPFLASPSSERSGRFSPDGRYVAYASDESGRPEVYVQSFPAGGVRTTISTSGGSAPIWSRDGKALFYVASDDEFVAVEVSTDGEFAVKGSTPLFRRKGMRSANLSASYDVSLDGRRFLVTEPADGSTVAPSRIHFLQNWQAKYLSAK